MCVWVYGWLVVFCGFWGKWGFKLDLILKYKVNVIIVFGVVEMYILGWKFDVIDFSFYCDIFFFNLDWVIVLKFMVRMG